MELRTTTKHMLIDIQDITRLLLGRMEEKGLTIMPEDRSTRAIAAWTTMELTRTGRGKSQFWLQQYVRERGGGTS